MDSMIKFPPFQQRATSVPKPHHNPRDDYNKSSHPVSNQLLPVNTNFNRRHCSIDDALEPVARNFALGQNHRPGSVQRWKDRKQHYLDIEMRNQEKRQRKKIVYHKIDTNHSLPSDRSQSFESFSSNRSIACRLDPPEKGVDDRETKSNIDLMFWQTGARKYQRQLDQIWVDLKKFKCLYEDQPPDDDEEDKDNLEKESSYAGSKLTENSNDSFTSDFQVTNKERNVERKEMYKIQKYARHLVKQILIRAFKRAKKNETLGVREFDKTLPQLPEIVKPLSKQEQWKRSRQFIIMDQTPPSEPVPVERLSETSPSRPQVRYEYRDWRQIYQQSNISAATTVPSSSRFAEALQKLKSSGKEPPIYESTMKFFTRRGLQTQPQSQIKIDDGTTTQMSRWWNNCKLPSPGQCTITSQKLTGRNTIKSMQTASSSLNLNTRVKLASIGRNSVQKTDETQIKKCCQTCTKPNQLKKPTPKVQLKRRK